jgi:AcrR family transcriptional regulator
MEERSRRIVATAVELAEQGGFEAVRLRDVASHAGVALGTLYRRFRSKEDLLLAALEQEITDFRDRLERRPAEGATRLARVVAHFQMTTRWMCRRPNLARALIRAVATGEPGVTQKVAAFHTQMEELVIAALRGVPPSAAGSATQREHQLALVFQQVWFASLVAWSSGMLGQPAIAEQMRTTAELLLGAEA